MNKIKKKKPFETRKMFLLVSIDRTGYDEYELTSPIPMDADAVLRRCENGDLLSISEEGKEEGIQVIRNWCRTASDGDSLEFSSSNYLICIGIVAQMPTHAQIVSKTITTVEVKVSTKNKE